jgi:hypothetical protein
LRVDYISEANELRIYLVEGAGPSEDIVVLDRDEGSIHFEFNRRGQLYGIGIIGNVERLIPPEFIQRFAKPS